MGKLKGYFFKFSLGTAAHNGNITSLIIICLICISNSTVNIAGYRFSGIALHADGKVFGLLFAFAQPAGADVVVFGVSFAKHCAVPAALAEVYAVPACGGVIRLWYSEGKPGGIAGENTHLGGKAPALVLFKECIRNAENISLPAADDPVVFGFPFSAYASEAQFGVSLRFGAYGKAHARRRHKQKQRQHGTNKLFHTAFFLLSCFYVL